MASSSSSSHSKKRKDGFSGIEPPGTRRKASDSTTLYDVFINHRGPDSKQTLALPLYESLEELGIRAFLDKEEMELGQSFPSAIETAINSALVHIAIISKRYAESPWCLQELILMQQTKAKIIPVFYGVEPWEVRYIEKGAYADAFIQYQNKSRYLEKLDVWKKALQDISFTAGHEIKDLNVSDYERIVIAVQKEVQRGKRLHVAKYPVALDKLVQDFQRRCLEKLVQDFEIKRGQNERKGKAGIVGIFGIGGVGKTTLCKELFNRKRGEYDRACFLFDVREASARSKLPSLQKQLLKDLFGVKKPSFQSTEEGSSSIFDHIERSELPSFLIVLDDINHLDQLETFMIMDLLKKPGNSLVIISTRDVGVLKRAGVEVCYHLQGMDKVDSRDLFSLHAFSQPHPATGYEDLVDAFLRVCGGLPLSLKVLGRHVHNQDINYWRIALDKYGERLHVDIKQILKISYDALETEEKQIFIDIACFFVDNLTDTAIRVWKASGWKAEYGLQTLKDRCLVEEINDSVPVLRMHDHLRDLGREMANEPSHPPRLWRPRDLKNLEPKGFENILIQTKRRCFHSFFDESLKSRITFLLGELDDSAAISTPLLLLQLDVEGYLSDSIPSWIPLQNMQCCTINGGHFNRLWRQDVQAPSQLKVLEISEQCNIIRLVISGNHCPKLQFLELSCMENLIEVKFTNCEDFERLNSLKISDCKDLKRLSVTSDLTKLEELNISACSQLDEASLDHLQYLKRITISDCNLKSMRGISSFTKLVELNISRCSLRNGLSLEQLVCLEKVMIENCSNLNSVTGISYLPKLVELSISLCWKLHLELRLVALNFLKRITVDSSLKVKSFELDGCKHLETVSGTNINFSKIQMVTISACPELRELPVIYGANCLEKITINGCVKLNYLQLTDCRNLKGLSGNFDLAELSINDCPMLAELPFFGHATCLKEIRILRCGNLENITLPTTLKRLELNACGELKNLTGISALKELVGLNIHACPKLQDLGVAHLTKLVDLEISECRELELCLSGMSCLENIAIIKSEKLQTITLPSNLTKLTLEACIELKRIEGVCDLTQLVELNIKNSPELEVDLHLSGSNCLYLISVECCNMNSITLPVTVLELKVQNCRKLQRIAGLKDLIELTELYISECPELKEIPSLAQASHFERIKIVSCNKLQIITLPTKLIKLAVQCCGHLQRIVAMPELKEVIELCVSDCPELEELPVIYGPSCVERITINGCGKFCRLQVTDCRILKGVGGNFAQLKIWDCPQLEELPWFAHLTCLEEILIYRCGKLKEITLPTNLKLLHLDACTELQSVSEISHLNNLEQMIISQCWQLELKLHLESMNSLQRITFDGCGKLRSFLLNKCQNVKGVSGNFDVERLSICDCPQLDELCISDCPGLSCLERVTIESCDKLQKITLPTKFTNLNMQRCRHLQRIEGMNDLTELCISECEELCELPSLARLSCLKRIKIDSCKKLHRITLPTTVNELSVHRCERLKILEGIDNLTELTKIFINECPDLEELPILAGKTCLEIIYIYSCERLQNITLPTKLVKLNVQCCGHLRKIAGMDDLTELYVSECSELEELPNLARLGWMESIHIDSCDKLHNITLPTTFNKLILENCRGLRRIEGMDDLKELTKLYISRCPELEELPIICGPNCLETITLIDCEKLNRLEVTDCRILKGVSGNFAQLKIWDCPQLEELPCFVHLTCLEEIHILRCGKLKEMALPTNLKILHLEGCAELQNMSEISHLNNLKQWISICDCPELEDLSICDYPEMMTIHIESCYKLQNVTLPTKSIKLFLQRCRHLPRIVGMDDLTELCISECEEMYELTILARLSCLKRIQIDSCQKLHNITLPTALIELSVHQCRKWKMVEGISNLTKLKMISISKCPELEELPILAGVSCLESINIDTCEKLHNITLPTKVMVISGCSQLNLSEMNCLESIYIDSCERIPSITLPTTLIKLTVSRSRKLQQVAGIDKLRDMVISECPELEELPNLSKMSCLESIDIDSCERLHDITLPTTIMKLRVSQCENLQRVVGTGNLVKIANMVISECPKLEELPNLSEMSCIESIEIHSNHRLRNITLPTTLVKLAVYQCTKLQRVASTGNLTKLIGMVISECPELQELPNLSEMSCLESIDICECPTVEELPSVARLSCLKSISTESCEKLANIAGIEELQALEAIKFLFYSNAAIQDCFRKLKSVPSAFIQIVGKAAGEAKSNLNPSLFSEAHFCANPDTLSQTLGHLEGSWSAIIVCGVVEANISDLRRTVRENMKYSTLEDLEQGEWIITTVTTVITEQHRWELLDCRGIQRFCFPRLVDLAQRRIEYCFPWRLKTKKWCAWAVRKWDDCRVLPALTTIVDKLHQK